MKTYKSISDLIGNTPLLELVKYNEQNKLSATILAKLEYFNPAGSVKDRIAKSMLEDAKSKGMLNKNTVLIEPTSGNTGIGLASLASAWGYRIILTMPEIMSIERRNLLKAYGAEVVLTEGTKGMKGAIEKAQELATNIPNSFILEQFKNMANPDIHYKTTGPEIWNDTDGNVDIFVSGVGTGGTISGVGKFLKEQKSNIEIYAIEPASSPVLSGGKSGSHKIQGIGAGFIPETLNTDIYNEIIAVTDENALNTAKELAITEGLLAGISSGAALWAATKLATKQENINKTIVVILADTGERYLSTTVFE